MLCGQSAYGILCVNGGMIYMEIKKDICPFCGEKDCKQTPYNTDDEWGSSEAIYYECNQIGEFVLHPSIWYGDEEKVNKRYTMIYLLVSNNKYKCIDGMRYKYKFFYEESSIGNIPPDSTKVNVAGLMKEYPETFISKMEKSLFNLYKLYGSIGQNFCVDSELFHFLFCTNREAEIREMKGVFDRLIELDYIRRTDGVIPKKVKIGEETTYIEKDREAHVITAHGWEVISRLESEKQNLNQGFLAMSFNKSTNEISETFKRAIQECGYLPKRIDEKEHNNQIVPEILFEISRSKFVVVDITFPNYGAYYEAGYAEALGKEVIICCRAEEFNGVNKPHFDIAQKSAIVWNNLEDLEKRLFKRIEATVGLNR